jgi:hypothetical protein
MLADVGKAARADLGIGYGRMVYNSKVELSGFELDKYVRDTAKFVDAFLNITRIDSARVESKIWCWWDSIWGGQVGARRTITVRQLKGFLECNFPTSGKNVLQHMRLVPALGAEIMYNMGTESSSQLLLLKKLVSLLRGHGYHALMYWVLACCNKPALLNVLVVAKQEGYTNSIESLTKFLSVLHDYARRAQMIPAVLRSKLPGLDWQDVLYLKGYAGRYWHKLLVMDETIETRGIKGIAKRYFDGNVWSEKGFAERFVTEYRSLVQAGKTAFDYTDSMQQYTDDFKIRYLSTALQVQHQQRVRALLSCLGRMLSLTRNCG